VLLNIDKKYADLEAVNAQFNADLQRHIDGTLPKNHIYRLGNPGKILLSAGIRDLPIELSAKRLSKKASESYRHGHPFDIADIKDLPRAINNPIAVFDNTKDSETKVILTELQHKGQNFVAVLDLRQSAGNGRNGTEMNDIITIFPKDQLQGILGKFNSVDDLLRWVDKEKALCFISTQPTNLTGGGNKGRAINNATNKINNFQNPFYP